jgi:hypothetical protein
MSDPLLALVLSISFLAILTAASHFRTLDLRLWRESRNPLLGGFGAAIVIALTGLEGIGRAAVIGVVFTFCALYIRLTGRESEPADGLAVVSLSGGAAALLLVVAGFGDLTLFAQCILASAAAGYGVTFGLTHVRDPLRQALVDALTAAAAVALAWGAEAALRIAGADEIAIATTFLIPLAVVASVFREWPLLRRELDEEATLNVIDPEDVSGASHPLLRLGRCGWHDHQAHREFVRIASLLALRKRQQRRRQGDVARIYQLEIIKLRMQLREMAQIDRAMRLEGAGPEHATR